MFSKIKFQSLDISIMRFFIPPEDWSLIRSKFWICDSMAGRDRVAQLVEQWTCYPKVLARIPPRSLLSVCHVTCGMWYSMVSGQYRGCDAYHRSIFRAYTLHIWRSLHSIGVIHTQMVNLTHPFEISAFPLNLFKTLDWCLGFYYSHIFLLIEDIFIMPIYLFRTYLMIRNDRHKYSLG